MNSRYYRNTMVILVFLVATPQSLAVQLLLNPKSLKEISFESIPKTKYEFSKEAIKISVQQSSSALVMPLEKVVTINKISFFWKLDGEVKTSSAEHESTKSGDDFPLRVGLCVYGPKPLIPFFAPAWVKKIRDILIHPSDQMTYLVAGSKHRPLDEWKSPYSNSMNQISLPDTPLKEGWREVNYHLKKDLRIVAIWIMADGDNTKSSFTTYLKNLMISKTETALPKTQASPSQ